MNEEVKEMSEKTSSEVSEATTEPEEVTEKAIASIANKVNPVECWADPTKFNHMVRVSSALSQSEFVPKKFQGKPADCLIALDMASRVNASPLMVMQNLYTVNGSPAWTGNWCMTMIRSCGRFSNDDHVRTGEVGTDSNGCYFTAYDKVLGKQVVGVNVTVATAKKAGWWDRNPQWRNNTELMLVYRAAAYFVREHCPEVLMGIITAEEINDISGAPARGARKADDIAAEIDG